MRPILAGLLFVIAARCAAALVLRTHRRSEDEDGMLARAGAELCRVPWLAAAAGARGVRRLAMARGRQPDAAVARAAVKRVGIVMAGAGLLIEVRHIAGPVVMLATAACVALVLSLERRGLARWRRAASSDVAILLDLMAGGVAMCGSPTAALRLVAPVVPESLQFVVRRACHRALLGEPALEALLTEAESFGLRDLGEACRSVVRDAEVGVPTAGRLQAMATELRAARESGRLTRAGRVVPLATLVSAMVIAPACVAMLAVLVVGSGLAGAAPAGLR